LIETDAKIARGAAALYFSSITTLVLNTIFLVLLANYYAADQAEVGVVSILNVVLIAATTVSILASPLIGTGAATPPAVTRFLSKYRGRGANPAKYVYFLSLGICAVISSGILLLSVYLPLADRVAGPAEASAVFYACLDAVAYSFAQLGAYSMLGNDRTTSAGKAIIASSVLRYVFASALLLAGYGPAGVFAGFAIGDSFLAVYANYFTGQDLRLSPAARVPPGPILKYMSSVFLAALMGLAVSQSDKFLAFLQLGLPTLAVYNVATVGAAVAFFVPSAITNVLVPSIGGYADESEKMSMLKAYTRHVSLSAIPIGFELAAVSPFLLRVFGDPYAAGAPIMAVIAIAIALTAVSAVYTADLLVNDRAHHFALSTVLGLVGLVAVAFLAVPSQGALGIAYARGAMIVVSSALTGYFVWREGRFVLDGGAYLKSVGASALMAAVVFGALTVAESLGLGRIPVVLGSMVMIPVGFAVYLFTMKLLKAYSRDDVEFLASLLPRWLGFLSKLARRFL
jgi:O-antigen/teichoic acid export membrane protein